MRNPPPREEGAAEAMFYELTIIPILHPPSLLMGRGRENRDEIKPGKSRGVE